MNIKIDGQELIEHELNIQIEWWIGRLTLAIGHGDFRGQVNLMIQYYTYPRKLSRGSR